MDSHIAKKQKEKADQQLNTTNSVAGGFGSNAQSLYGTLVPQAESLINSKGYDPATLAAITNAGMGSVNAAGGAAKAAVGRTTARTGNPASVGATQDAIARTQGQVGGQEAGNIQIQNADFAAQQRQQGLNLLNSMYGTNVGGETSMYGMGPATLQARAAGQNGPQQFSDVLNSLSGGATAGKTAAG